MTNETRTDSLADTGFALAITFVLFMRDMARMRLDLLRELRDAINDELGGEA